MRAIKLMMSRPGITTAKVATLVGGPDWPTSVMMGLMGMPLGPILLGTTPIILLIAPLAFSGGFMTRGPQAPYPALMNVALSLSTITQGMTMLKMAQASDAPPPAAVAAARWPPSPPAPSPA